MVRIISCAGISASCRESLDADGIAFDRKVFELVERHVIPIFTEPHEEPFYVDDLSDLGEDIEWDSEPSSQERRRRNA